MNQTLTSLDNNRRAKIRLFFYSTILLDEKNNEKKRMSQNFVTLQR